MGSRTLSKAHDAIATIESEVTTSASEIVLLQIDIEDDELSTRAYDYVSSTYKKLDALVNNAGKSPFPNSATTNP
jgi:NADP-dependent 3-hydroxy acid dehydrogenase YdfG